MPSAILEAAYEQLLATKGLERPPLRPRSEFAPSPEEYRIAMHNAGQTDEEINETMGFLAGFANAPTFTQMIQDLSVEVEADIRGLGCALETEVYAAEFPTGDLNAQILGTAGGCLVLVNNGLMMTLFLVLKTMVRSLGFGPKGSDRPAIEPADQTTVVNELLPVLQAYHYGDVRQTQRKEVLVGMQASLLSRLVWQTEKFVVAHEYAHLLSGHVGPWGREALDSSYAPREFIPVSHQQEYDADLQAVTILMSSADATKGDTEVKYRLAGPFLFLGIHDMLSRVGDVLYRKPIGYSLTHPPTASRIEKLREYVVRKYGDNLCSHADLFSRWLKTYADFIVTATQEGHVFEPEECAGLYRNIIAARDAATNDLDRGQAEADAEMLRNHWKVWMGAASLHEIAFKDELE